LVSSRFLSPLPSPSTLFPYTTLFRSGRDLFALRRFQHFSNHLQYLQLAFSSLRCHRAPLPGVSETLLGLDQRTHAFIGQNFQQQDRKSTRLNSSHVKISYAVFCLKKK